jgi:hypothetical protein
MTGFPGNQWTLALGAQVAKGTAQTTPEYKVKATGGDIAPNVPTAQLAETDASAQQAASYKPGPFQVEGAPSIYARPADLGIFLLSVLGNLSDTGGPPNYTHEFTPALQPTTYLTGFKAMGGVLVDRYVDLICNQLSIAGAAGQPLTITATFLGLSFKTNQADPVLTPVSDAVFCWPHVSMLKGGADPGTLESFDLTINRNPNVIVGDVGFAVKDVGWGKIDVTGGFTYVPDNDDDYNRFHSGSAAATDPTADVFTEALSFKAQIDANTSVLFEMDEVSYRSYPLPPDPAGAGATRVATTFGTEPQATLAGNITATLKNQVATY